MELIKPDVNINFIGGRKVAGAISITLVLASLVIFFAIGPKYGIDFAGGVETRFEFDQHPDLDAMRKALGDIGLDGVEIAQFDIGQDIGGKLVYTIKAKGEIEDIGGSPEEQAESDVQLRISKKLKEMYGADAVHLISTDMVGPRVGGELRKQAFWAVIAAMIGMLLYIGYRFDYKYAPGAVVALAHDVIITFGIFVILGKEFNLTIIAALLTIAGYSLNDTIIVFDRIREGRGRVTLRRLPLPEIVNRCINETLSRTVLTSATTLIVVVALYFLGGEILRDFAFAMICGVVVGTYSSIFVASPVFLALETFLQNRKRSGKTGRQARARPDRRVATTPPARPIPRRWSLTEADPARVGALAEAAEIPETVARILVTRGIADAEGARRFLDPKLADLVPPDSMCDLDRAARRVARAVADGEPIAVFGDFDVDGVTSVSLLDSFFRDLGVSVRTHIPHRVGEGYGLNEAAVREFAEAGVRVMITVDCGISDGEVIATAQELGIDVIVTDHHRVGAALPPAHAVVDPNRPDCGFPFKHLAGVGLAFYLAAATRSRLVEDGAIDAKDAPDLRNYLDLVALGTVADIAELTGANRILTAYGLTLLTEERRVGVRALKEVARIGKKPVTAGSIGFQLGPRINAAGRVGEPMMGVKLLTTDSVSTALDLAYQLEEANRVRQSLEQKILEDARRLVLEDPDGANRAALVLASDRWHPGVVGIVASKIVDEFNKPAILIALKEDRGRGSARSTRGYNIHGGIEACQQHLEAFGGHKMAAGLEVRTDRLAAFREAFEAVTREAMAGADPRPTLTVDLELPLADVDADLIATLGRLAPFGFGNPEPVLVTRGARIVERKVVGGRHLKLLVEQGGVQREAIWFQRAAASKTLPADIDLAYQAKLDTYLGRSRVVLYVKDARAAE